MMLDLLYVVGAVVAAVAISSVVYFRIKERYMRRMMDHSKAIAKAEED